MNRYYYDGPVLIFGKLIADHWKAETIAESKEKARSNFKYQYKKNNNLILKTKVDLPGEIYIK